MKATKYTDDELRRKVKHLFSVAQSRRVEAEAYLMEKKDGRGERARSKKMRNLHEEEAKVRSKAVYLRDSGQIPWVVENGLGNNCDMTKRTTEVIARRVFDTFAAESDLSDFGGRAIELTVTVSGNLGSTQYTLAFRDPATVQAVIEQLQQELDGWDDWNGESYEF